jgi:hypothetical protein
VPRFVISTVAALEKKNVCYNRYKRVVGPGEILVGPVETVIETEFQGRLGFSEDNRPAHYNFLYC